MWVWGCVPHKQDFLLNSFLNNGDCLVISFFSSKDQTLFILLRKTKAIQSKKANGGGGSSFLLLPPVKPKFELCWICLLQALLTL